MEKIGIICEYNPLHNGHIYHIEKIREMYPDSLIILVLGGYFLERGDISLISKWNKTKISLEYGINLVIELPTLYNTNSSDYFAKYAIEALKHAKVDKIIFGSETADIDLLLKIAESQNDEKFQENIRSHLKSGKNYPTSISESLGINLKSNDILGVSYIKAIKNTNANIEPIPIKRTNEYLDLDSNDPIISAQNIREKIKGNIDIAPYIPNYDLKLINKINEEKLFELLKYKIITTKDLSIFLGVDEGLENKIKKEINNSKSYNELLTNIKSKRYTTTRLKRMLIHILLGIEKEDMNETVTNFKILGFDSLGQKYLKILKEEKFIFRKNDTIQRIENTAAYLYYELTKDESYKHEFLFKPIIKK